MAPERDLRLLVSDVDGTLLNPTGQLTDATIAALRRWVDSGRALVLATGRNLTLTQPIAAAIQRPLHLILQDGALLINYPQQQILSYHNLSTVAVAVALQLFQAARQPVLSFDPLPHGDGFTLCPFGPLSDGLRRYLASKKGAFQTCPHGRWPATSSKLVTIDRDERLKPLRQTLDAHLADVRLIQTEGGRLGGWFLEVGSAQGGKRTALQTLLAHLKLTPAQTVAVGDAENDRDMLALVGLGVAMGNAAPRIIAAADMVIGSHAEDGLAAFIHQLLRA